MTKPAWLSRDEYRDDITDIYAEETDDWDNPAEAVFALEWEYGTDNLQHIRLIGVIIGYGDDLIYRDRDQAIRMLGDKSIDRIEAQVMDSAGEVIEMSNRNEYW